MAAKTRGEIKTLVEGHTGRTKDTLENASCDEALKIALLEHSFKDAQSIPTDIAITEDATSVTIVTSDVINIVTARIVEADGSRNKILMLRTRTWWDKHIINPEDNPKGWPIYGLRVASTIVLDRPATSGLELRLRVTTEQVFTDDTTVCPIYVLDAFVEAYTTAQVYAEIEDWDSYKFWITKACGSRWLADGKPGGLLLKAIQNDSLGDTALELKADEVSNLPPRRGGVAVENLITGHGDEGNTRTWY